MLYIRLNTSIGTRWLRKCDLSNEKMPLVVTTGKIEKAMQWPSNEAGFQTAQHIAKKLQRIGITCGIHDEIDMNTGSPLA